MKQIPYPEELTPALAEVLGMPPYALAPYWQALRACGEPIVRRYEAETGAALHFLIPFALEHGMDWQEKAHHALNDRLDLARAMDAASSDGAMP